MNLEKNLNFLQKPLCPSFTQLLIKFPPWNFLRAVKLYEIRRKVDTK